MHVGDLYPVTIIMRGKIVVVNDVIFSISTSIHMFKALTQPVEKPTACMHTEWIWAYCCSDSSSVCESHTRNIYVSEPHRAYQVAPAQVQPYDIYPRPTVTIVKYMSSISIPATTIGWICHNTLTHTFKARLLHLITHNLYTWQWCQQA